MRVQCAVWKAMRVQYQSLKARWEAASLLKPLASLSNSAVASIASVSAASVSVASVSVVSVKDIFLHKFSKLKQYLEYDFNNFLEKSSFQAKVKKLWFHCVNTLVENPKIQSLI
jgi:hypothetical protein